MFFYFLAPNEHSHPHWQFLNNQNLFFCITSYSLDTLDVLQINSNSTSLFGMASGSVCFLFGWYNLSGVFLRSWADESIFDCWTQVGLWSNEVFLVSFITWQFCDCDLFLGWRKSDPLNGCWCPAKRGSRSVTNWITWYVSLYFSEFLFAFRICKRHVSLFLLFLCRCLESIPGWFRAVLFEKCSGSDGLLGRAELSEVLWQDLQVLREGKRGSRVDASEIRRSPVEVGSFLPWITRFYTSQVVQDFVPSMVSPKDSSTKKGGTESYRGLFWGWGVPYISLAYSLYRRGFLHVRYLKCLIILRPKKVTENTYYKSKTVKPPTLTSNRGLKVYRILDPTWRILEDHPV